MGGKDLFHQRGARSQHADDEDGHVARVSERALLRHECSVEGGAAALDERTPGIHIEAHALVLEGIAALEVREGALVLSDVVQHLSEREMQVSLPLLGVIRSRREHFHEFDLLSIVVAEAPGPGDILMGDGEPRVGVQGAAEARFGFVETPQDQQADAHVVERHGVSGIDGNGAAKRIQRIVQVSNGALYRTERDIVVRIARVDFDSPARSTHRRVQLALIQI